MSESEMKNGSYTNMHKMLRRLYGKYDIYSRRRTDCEQSQHDRFYKEVRKEILDSVWVAGVVDR